MMQTYAYLPLLDSLMISFGLPNPLAGDKARQPDSDLNNTSHTAITPVQKTIYMLVISSLIRQ